MCTLARVRRQRCSQKNCSRCHHCSEHNNRNCPVSTKITPAEVSASSWGSVCVPGWDVSAAPAPAAAVGVAPAPAGLFQLPSHREPPQMTVHERCCERQEWTMSFPVRTQRTLWNVRVKKRTAAKIGRTLNWCTGVILAECPSYHH